jgi:hypothetical protein
MGLHGNFTFFDAMMSNHDFKNFKVENTIVYDNFWARLYLLFFIVITAILVVNLIIAIISNVYNTLKRDSLGVYLDDIVRKRPLMVYDKYYSGLVSIPFPLNVLAVFFWPVYMKVKS